MQNQNSKERLRTIVGSALCDFVSYLDSVPDPFIIGGQYTKEKLIKAFQDWLFTKKFDIEDVGKGAKNWITMCQQDFFTGSKDFTTPPSVPPTTPPPKTFTPPATPPTNCTDCEEDCYPPNGYYKDDEWRPKEDRKKRWQDEGEDWKDDEEPQSI